MKTHRRGAIAAIGFGAAAELSKRSAFWRLHLASESNHCAASVV
jgi:hypothetical protein